MLNSGWIIPISCANIKSKIRKNITSSKNERIGAIFVKTAAKCVKIDEKIENIFAKFEKTDDLEKCLKALSFVTKFE